MKYTENWKNRINYIYWRKYSKFETREKRKKDRKNGIKYEFEVTWKKEKQKNRVPWNVNNKNLFSTRKNVQKMDNALFSCLSGDCYWRIPSHLSIIVRIRRNNSQMKIECNEQENFMRMHGWLIESVIRTQLQLPTKIITNFILSHLTSTTIYVRPYWHNSHCTRICVNFV